MTRKTPDHLVTRLLNRGRIEAHYRADERLKIFTDLRAALGVEHADIYGKPQQPAQTDMHGEPVAGTESPKFMTSNPDFLEKLPAATVNQAPEMVSIMSRAGSLHCRPLPGWSSSRRPPSSSICMICRSWPRGSNLRRLTSVMGNGDIARSTVLPAADKCRMSVGAGRVACSIQ